MHRDSSPTAIYYTHSCMRMGSMQLLCKSSTPPTPCCKHEQRAGHYVVKPRHSTGTGNPFSIRSEVRHNTRHGNTGFSGFPSRYSKGPRDDTTTRSPVRTSNGTSSSSRPLRQPAFTGPLGSNCEMKPAVLFKVLFLLCTSFPEGS